jgi:hypothetical protein
VATLKDIDIKSSCENMVWESDFDELRDIKLFKQL